MKLCVMPPLKSSTPSLDVRGGNKTRGSQLWPSRSTFLWSLAPTLIKQTLNKVIKLFSITRSNCQVSLIKVGGKLVNGLSSRIFNTGKFGNNFDTRVSEFGGS